MKNVRQKIVILTTLTKHLLVQWNPVNLVTKRPQTSGLVDRVVKLKGSLNNKITEQAFVWARIKWQ